jgi:predicted N-acetyltransferase YhbS
MSFQVVPLENYHERQEFACGRESPDNYIRKQASQDFKKKLAVCFVIADDSQNVIGYYTLSSSSIPVETAPIDIKKKVPGAYKNLPVLLLGRLAVDSQWKGRGLGAFLLTDAISRCFEASKQIGSIAIVVDPLDNDAINFYQKYGFIQLSSGRMLLNLKTVLNFFPKG